MALYLIPNGAAGLTTAPVKKTTGSVIKTMLQFKPSATIGAKIVEWGVSFDGLPVDGQVELVETGIVAATVTAHVAAGITKYDSAAVAGADPTTNLIQVGTAATGYNASVEGTPTVARLFDLQLMSTNQFVKQFPLGREPWVQTGNILRIRTTFTVAVNAYCYILVEV